MNISTIIPHIEALIFASERPLTSLELTEFINNAFGFMEDKINLDQVESSIEGIMEKYSASFYPFEMKQSGGGWQFLTKKDYHKTVAQLNGEKFLKKLSAASLETLAIIAYKQPITKGEVEAIRGVNSDYSVQKLLEKELVVITGRNEELPGKPLVYTTSKSFMDYFGINSPDELPRIKEVFAEQAIEATVVKGIEENHFEITDDLTEPGEDVYGEEESLVIRGNGELIEEPLIVVDENTAAIDPEVLETSEEDEIVDHEINVPYEKEMFVLKEEDRQASETEKEETKNKEDKSGLPSNDSMKEEPGNKIEKE